MKKAYKISHNTKQFKEYLKQEQISFTIEADRIIVDAYCDTDIFDLGMGFQKWLTKKINKKINL